MPQNLAAPPLQTPLSERDQTGAQMVTKVWADWWRSIVNRAQASAYQSISALGLSGQSASIGLTSLIPLASGLYRVSWRTRVTTAAGVSSSLQVSIVTTEGGVTTTYAGAVYTGNSTGAPQTGSFIVRADPSSPLQYSVTYASNPGAAMLYDLDFVVESL